MAVKKSKKDRPRVLCISCDAAYSLNSKFITIHETIQLPTNRGKLVRFSCSKCKGETTSMVLNEEDIKSGYSPMLHQIKTEQQDRYNKQGINKIVNEDVVNKGKKDK
ncbi:MAG TPA: hypothetical protein DEO59_04150 [Balneola sp.]|nr:hypothetical protein [Balneola sp.]